MSDAVVTTSIVVERTLPHSREKIWRTLTEPDLISQWLMPNDFRPIVGHRFKFHTKPQGDWDGVVDCEVLEVEPGRQLRYTWCGGSTTNSRYGSRLETVVTWTLTSSESGTLLRMQHEGFKPENEFAFNAMKPGWARVLESIARVTETLA